MRFVLSMGCCVSSDAPVASDSDRRKEAKDDVPPDTPFHRKYKLDMSASGELGSGSYAIVRKGQEKDGGGEVYAIKCVDKSVLSEKDRSALDDEVMILNKLQHKNIMRLVESFNEDDPAMLYLVTELVEGGELFERIVNKECYTEKEARFLVRILLQTLDYMHKQSIVHRDLKPENLLLKSLDNDYDIKLADFGYAAMVNSPSENSLQDQCGTPNYVAPEIITHIPYGTKVDMWSAGVIVFILLGGYPPFHANQSHELYSLIRTANFKFDEEYWAHVSDDAKDLIRKLLEIDPAVRLSAEQALEHPWIKADDTTLANYNLDKNLDALRQFNARRKLKAAVKTVILANQMGATIGGKTGDESGEELGSEEPLPLDSSSIGEENGLTEEFPKG